MPDFIMIQNHCVIADNASNAQIADTNNAKTFLAEKILQCLKRVPPKAVSNYLRTFFVMQVREAKNATFFYEKYLDGPAASVMVLELLTLVGALEDAIQEECN